MIIPIGDKLLVQKTDRHLYILHQCDGDWSYPLFTVYKPARIEPIPVKLKCNVCHVTVTIPSTPLRRAIAILEIGT